VLNTALNDKMMKYVISNRIKGHSSIFKAHIFTVY